MPRRFYTLEGIDGCGKTTAMQYIGKLLELNDIPHVLVSAYPKDEDSMRLRSMWINQDLPANAEAAVILELRRRVLEDTIIPALIAGKVVISDRYNDTTWVYQCVGRGVDADVIDSLIRSTQKVIETVDWKMDSNEAYLDLTRYHTLHLAVSPEVAAARINMRGNHDAFEKNGIEYFDKLEKAYRQHYKCHRNEKHVEFIDADQTLERMCVQIASYFATQLGCSKMPLV